MKSKQDVKYMLDDQGSKTGVVLDIKEFEKMIDELEDLHDLVDVYTRKSKNLKTFTYEELRSELFGKNAK